MPSGLQNTPATFQAAMNKIFRPFIRQFILVFFDYIIEYSRNKEEHEGHPRRMFKVLQEHKFVANRKKCKFGQPRVEYSGHIVSDKGWKVDPIKVLCVKQWPTPKSVKGVGGFLGLTGYYRRFIWEYGKIVKPLTDLLKKDEFQWGELARESFEKLKE